MLHIAPDQPAVVLDLEFERLFRPGVEATVDVVYRKSGGRELLRRELRPPAVAADAEQAAVCLELLQYVGHEPVPRQVHAVLPELCRYTMTVNDAPFQAVFGAHAHVDDGVVDRSNVFVSLGGAEGGVDAAVMDRTEGRGAITDMALECYGANGEE